MEQYHDNAKIKNGVWAAALVGGLFLLAVLRYDLYYELNDDMVIADILSGKYTGIPEARTNQLLYPLGWFLSFCYRLLPQAPIYPLFLSAAIGVSLWMIYFSSLSLFAEKKSKLGCGILLLLLSCVLITRQMVLVQYTAVSGMLCGASCFWFLTRDTAEGVKWFWRTNLPALFCFLLAFNLRSEMALLCLPLAGICGLFRWYQEVLRKNEQSRERRKKKRLKAAMEPCFLLRYFLFFCVILLFMGIFLVSDHLAYRGGEWKTFRDFFDARTRVYDYTWYPSYEKEEAFYQEKGISKIQYELIDNYNFGLDSSITAETLKTIADYNEKERNSGGIGGKLKYKGKEVVSCLFRPADTPYNYFVIAGYIFVILLAILQKREKEYGGKLFFLFLARSISWFYILWAERVVERIILPLYLIEFLILMAIVAKEVVDRPLWNIERYVRRVVICVLAILAILFLPQTDKELRVRCEQRRHALESQEALELYTKVHPEEYYYLDVYSMVDFTAKMYDRENEKRNYDFLGGWICNSPHQKKSREGYVAEEELEEIEGYFNEEDKKKDTISKVLLLDNFYVIARKNREVIFLEEYYDEYGIPVEVIKKDQIETRDDPFIVYQVVPSE